MEALLKGFPEMLRPDVMEVIKILPEGDMTVPIINQVLGQEHFILDGEEVTIVRRLYLDEPVDESGLSEMQQVILHCIYLRHHDGYVRQRRLARLLGRKEYFIIPYTMQLLGEYVYPILIDLDQHIHKGYVEFIKENSLYWRKTQDRVITYWHIYHWWRCKDYKKYIGNRIVERLLFPAF